ncbi:hypothetical protein NQ315_006173, partial [Exocentrus adspersus]
SCHPVKEDYINVHLVAHTHDDVGWLKTVDQYFYGARTRIQNAGVQTILDSVMDALKKDRNRRFIYVETAFFWKWWIKQHDTVKAHVRRFVKNGQLEFIGGAWSMNDEATTHYQSIIDQFTWGLRKLNDSFGECGRPKMGWQIDPFGHSRQMASIFAQLGFDGLLLGRIDYQDKNFRLATKSAEMVWRGSSNLGAKSDIFTGVMYNTYAPPKGFCFDIICTDDPIIDDKKSSDYNVDRRVDEFLAYVKNMTDGYATNNVIVTMGEDFTYQNAEVWFKNLDKLIHYANLRQANGSKYNLLYSTPSCYVKAIYDETHGKAKWLVKEDDFFPYASDPHSFWTGYFTSRPTIKRFEREGNNFLQVCKHLYALADLGPEDRVDLNAMREAMGVMQHHDAVTGTEKEHVAHDYAKILSTGIDECEIITNQALSKLIDGTGYKHPEIDPMPGTTDFTICRLLNTSQCEFTETNDNFVVTVYNPLSRSVSKFIRLPVTGIHYTVQDPKGKLVVNQMIPIAQPILRIPGRQSAATSELVFQATDVPPLGFNSYFVRKTDQPIIIEQPTVSNTSGAVFEIDPDTGFISQITANNKRLNISQEFFYYNGFVGDNTKASNRSSGAYIFRPFGEAVQVAAKASVKVYQGLLVSEVHQEFNEWVSQIVRIYEGENYVEFDWLIGPIPVTDNHFGKEVITRYKTRLNSDSVFYTDSNGRELVKRVRNFRPTWKVSLQEPVAGNYYPVTSKILLRSGQDEVAVLTDRAQGGTSLRDGEIELMLHRACLHDDAFGVGEALIEEAFNSGLVARGSHYLVFGSTSTDNPDGKSVAAQERILAQNKLLDTWTFLSSTKGLSFADYKAKYKTQFSGLKQALPDNVQILTLEPWKGFSLLLRLEHILEKDEDNLLSKPVTVNLQNLFSPFAITSLRETTLGANQWLSDNNKLEFEVAASLEALVDVDQRIDDSKLRGKWNDNGNGSNVKRAVLQVPQDLDDFTITLQPMQIRTFVVEIQRDSLNI